MRLRLGFTLIEMLVVVGIISTLAAMATPMVTGARKRAAKAETQSYLQLIDMGLGLFKAEIGAFPYQSPGDPLMAGNTNLLAWHLVTVPTTAQLTALRSATQAVVVTYSPSATGTVSNVVDLDMDRIAAAAGIPTVAWAALTRNIMGADLARCLQYRARLGVQINCTDMKGVRGAVDRSTLAQFTLPAGVKGWAGGYLAGQIPSKRIQGDALLDRWGTPVQYINPVIPGVAYSFGAAWANKVTGPASLNAAFFRVAQQGPNHVEEGRAEAISLSSDSRTTAIPNFRGHYELWSAGPDRVIQATRNHVDNSDNIPFQDYHRGLN